MFQANWDTGQKQKPVCFFELQGVFKADCKSDFMKGAVCQCAQGVGLILVCA